MIPKPGEPIHYKPCTLLYSSECDDCETVIPSLGERWIAYWSENSATDGNRPVLEVHCHVICGKCMAAKDGKDLQRTLLSLWDLKRKGKNETPSCSTPRQSQSNSQRVYLPGTPAPKD